MYLSSAWSYLIKLAFNSKFLEVSLWLTDRSSNHEMFLIHPINSVSSRIYYYKVARNRAKGNNDCFLTTDGIHVLKRYLPGISPSHPDPGRREKINLNFYFNTTFLNARGEKG